MGKYRKKPVVIDAIKFTEMDAEQPTFTFETDNGVVMNFPVCVDSITKKKSLQINTLEGTMFADVGDWIICGLRGEYYPCKPDIFIKSYEPADCCKRPGFEGDPTPLIGSQKHVR